MAKIFIMQSSLWCGGQAKMRKTKMRVIKKAILPVAGLGTRLMPLTLHQPKSMMNIVDKPMVHYVVDEILAAGIRKIILVVNPKQRQFKNYFDYFKNDPEWQKLKLKLEFAVQKRPLGNADAVYSARPFLEDEPVLITFSDDLLIQPQPPLITLINFYKKTKSPIIVLEKVPWKYVSRYGVVKTKKTKIHPDLYEIIDIVEKPKPEEAPSNLTVVGRYILTPEIFKQIERLYALRKAPNISAEGRSASGRKKEVGLTDAFKLHLENGGKIFGWHFKGERFDCGSKIGLLKCQAYFGLKHPEFKKEFKKYLKKIVTYGI